MLPKAATVRHTPEFPRGDGTTMTMAERPTSYEYEDLLTCGRGELFGRGNAQLPLPPMLMFDRISSISEAGGAHGKGQIVAELKVSGNPDAGLAVGLPLQGRSRSCPAAWGSMRSGS